MDCYKCDLGLLLLSLFSFSISSAQRLEQSQEVPITLNVLPDLYSLPCLLALSTYFLVLPPYLLCSNSSDLFFLLFLPVQTSEPLFANVFSPAITLSLPPGVYLLCKNFPKSLFPPFLHIIIMVYSLPCLIFYSWPLSLSDLLYISLIYLASYMPSPTRTETVCRHGILFVWFSTML